jgi:hypothetical protein
MADPDPHECEALYSNVPDNVILKIKLRSSPPPLNHQWEYNYFVCILCLTVDESGEREVVEEVREILPDVGVPVLAQTLVVEPVHLHIQVNVCS